MSLMDTLTPLPPPVALDRDGVLRINHTRVTLDVVIEAYEEGATVEQIVQDYDSPVILQLAG
jgi:uncharacterized protein (DUF433 family)